MRRKGENEKEKKVGEKRRLASIRQSFSLLFSSSPFLLFFIFLVSPLPALAATVAEYRAKIVSAESLINDLVNIDEENLTPQRRFSHESEILTKLRQTLPASEKVDWKNTSVETNNQWFHDKLNEYEKDKNESKRAAVLSELGEWLAAAGQRLDELEKPSVSERAKDEDKRKLGEILRREEYQKPVPPEKSFLRRMWEKIAEWFKSETPDTPSIAPSSAGFESIAYIMQILLYAVIIGAIGFLIYRFAPFLANRFNKREKREKKERVILGERIAADESSDNIFSEAERLAREGNLRGAIRKGYIALLCELSDRKIIGLSHHKTNRDYLRDVRKRRELHENMNGLTSNFERHWYGSEEAQEKDWEEFRSGYRKAVSSER